MSCAAYYHYLALEHELVKVDEIEKDMENYHTVRLQVEKEIEATKCT